MRTCIDKSHPLLLHDDKNKRVAGVTAPELSVQELKKLCAAFLVNLELLAWYHVFVSYRWGPQDKPLVDGMFTRCTLHSAGPPDFQVRHTQTDMCVWLGGWFDLVSQDVLLSCRYSHHLCLCMFDFLIITFFLFFFICIFFFY